MNKRDEQILGALGARDAARVQYRAWVQIKRDRHGDNRTWNFKTPVRQPVDK